MSRRRQQSINRDGKAAVREARAGSTDQVPRETSDEIAVSWLVAGAVVLLAASLWAYWPTLVEMVGQWIQQPDYSHGFLVIPLSLFFLWSRRAQCPRDALRPSLLGAGLLLLAAAMRVAAGALYFGPLDGWTIPVWIAGSGLASIWVAVPAVEPAGHRVSVVYGPDSIRGRELAERAAADDRHQAEHGMFGDAGAAGTGRRQYDLDRRSANWHRRSVLWFANSGGHLRAGVCLRVVLALELVAEGAGACGSAAHRDCRERRPSDWLLGCSFNSQRASVANHFMHDLSGIVMIPFAFALFWLFLIYLDRLFPEIEVLSALEAGASDR